MRLRRKAEKQLTWAVLKNVLFDLFHFESNRPYIYRMRSYVYYNILWNKYKFCLSKTLFILSFALCCGPEFFFAFYKSYTFSAFVFIFWCRRKSLWLAKCTRISSIHNYEQQQQQQRNLVNTLEGRHFFYNFMLFNQVENWIPWKLNFLFVYFCCCFVACCLVIERMNFLLFILLHFGPCFRVTPDQKISDHGDVSGFLGWHDIALIR